MNGYCFEAFAGLTGSATKTIQRFKAQKMKKYGLSSAHTNCICWLARAGEEGLTQTELVRCEMMDPSQVSRVLRELSDKGYVRPGGEEGRYRRRYSLTEQGRQAAREIQGIIEEIRDFVISRFDNLGKGASGAAIQNMNILLGVDEKTGLSV